MNRRTFLHLATSRALKSRATGLSVRFFRVTIPMTSCFVHFGRRPIRRGDGLVIAGIRNASQEQSVGEA
jgi:hypothetical protein